MHYYIDGYNLLFRTLQSSKDLRSQREALITDLAAKANFLRLNITLVFDSYYQQEEESYNHVNNLKVYFTNVGETADDFIVKALNQLEKSDSQTVITSDRDLANRCRIALANTQSVEEFSAWIDKRCKNKLREHPLPLKPSKKSVLERPLKKQIVSPLPSKKISDINNSPLLNPTTSVEACFDVYLKIFEESSLKNAEKKPEKKPNKLKTKKTSKKKPPSFELQDPLQSDMLRWLHAFEKKNEDL